MFEKLPGSNEPDSLWEELQEDILWHEIHTETVHPPSSDELPLEYQDTSC